LWCLCFALDRAQQRRSGFRYQYSSFQLEYSRNLVFAHGAALEEICRDSSTGPVGPRPDPEADLRPEAPPASLCRAGAVGPRIERALVGSVY
jgi:hypothetical protein